MTIAKMLFVCILSSICSLECLSQKAVKTSTKQAEPKAVHYQAKASPAYAEILLRKAELQSELESLLIEYTEDYPKVAELRFSLTVLQKDSERILAVQSSESIKLTLALGKLMVKRAELATDLWQLLKTYKEEHPDVKRAKRKVEIYESAIKEILG